jgi:hypothetical protein
VVACAVIVQTGESWTKSMTSSWIPPIVCHALG